jgi:succinoglycan biosynthesis transport protein ExoP
MLQVNKPQLVSVSDRSVPEPEFISPRQLYTSIEGFVRRQYPVIAFVLLLALGLSALYLVTTPPKYTGHAVLVIDTHRSQAFPQQAAMTDMPLDSTMVETQLEILRSDSIAQSVVKDLRLNEDPEFSRPRAGFVPTIVGLVTNIFTAPFSTKEPPSSSQLMGAAVATLHARLSVRRVGLTYAIEIDAQSFNPQRAAQIANAVAEAYVVDTLEAKYQTTRRAAVWLQDRLKELREQSSTAERAVVEFKAKNNIVETGGKLMNEQQLTELNTALIQARAQTAEAHARLERIDQILKSDAPDSATTAAATVADTLHSDVINRLRQTYLDLQAHESDWSKRFGPDHLAVVNVRNQMREIRHSILDELQRIAETYKSDYQIARTREESVQKSLAEIVTQSQTTNEAQVTLHSLESSAQTYKSLYDTFLQRYMESVQQQSFPLSEARMITQASGGYRSAPNTFQVVAMAAMGGLFLGVGIGLLREISDRVFRTTIQVEELLQADCIAVVPLMKNDRKATSPGGQGEFGLQSKVVDSPFARFADSIRTVTAASDLKGLFESDKPVAIAPSRPKLEPVGEIAPRTLRRDQSMLWAVTDAPFSRFAESIRAIKVAADLKKLVKENKVIGITSSLPNEGKSTLAMAFAGLISQSASVVLVDGDLRNPSLSRALAPGATLGILDLISGKASFDEVAWTDPETKLVFVPAVVQSRLAHSSEILASDAMRKFFETLRAAYEYVIVDLSPLAPVVDVRAMTHLVDSFLFVVEWGRTKIDVAEHALDMARGVHENLLGIVLNKADMNGIGRYESYRGNYYYKRYYARYGYTE